MTPGLTRAIVRLAAPLVPRRGRDAWRQEWLAELSYSWRRAGEIPGVRARWRLSARAACAFTHALWLRNHREQFGNVVRSREDGRGVRIAPWLDSLWQDVRYAVRMWRRQPALTVAAWTTLGLGLGLVGTVYAVVYSVLMRPLPVDDERSLAVAFVTEAGMRDDDPVSYPRYLEWRAGGAFRDLAAISSRNLDVTAPDGLTESTNVATVSANFFNVVGARPQLGRVFGPADRGATGIPAVISDVFWRTRFAADPNVVGRSINTSAGALVVVGVMPPGFHRWPQPAHIWAPEEKLQEARFFGSRGWILFRPIGRLHPGQSIEETTRRLDAVDSRAEERDPAQSSSAARIGVRVSNLRSEIVSPRFETLLTILLAGVGLAWLVVCANLSNLLLARGVGRSAELAIRLAIGAHRRRVIRQLLVESAALAVPASAIGALFAFVAVRLVVGTVPADLLDADVVWIDWRVLAAFALLTATSALVFGVVPAVRSSRANLNEVSQERVSRASRTSSVVLVVEVAVAVVVLTGAALLLKSLVRIRGVDLGFDASSVITVDVRLPSRTFGVANGANDDRFLPVQRDLLARLRSLPGVEMVSIGGRMFQPGVDRRTSIDLDDGRLLYNSNPDHHPFLPLQHFAGPEYFRTHRVPVRRGRELTDRDDFSAPRVVVVNEAMASMLWPGENPIGRRMNFGYRRVTRTREFVYDEPWAEVVGIVADVRHGGVDLPVRPAAFRSVLQYPRQRFDVILRSPLPMHRLMPSVRDAVRQVDPSIMVSRERRLSDAVADASATVRYASAGLSVFAVFISALCAFGVYSLLAFVVAARRREIGIRVALGAAPSRLIRHFVAMTTKVLVPGLVAGLLASIAGTRVLHALLYDTSPVDPVVLAAVMGAVSLIVIAGAALPARTASTVEPAVALRD